MAQTSAKTSLFLFTRLKVFSWQGSHKNIIARDDVILTRPYSTNILHWSCPRIGNTIRLTGCSFIGTMSLIWLVLGINWHRAIWIIENSVYSPQLVVLQKGEGLVLYEDHSPWLHFLRDTHPLYLPGVVHTSSGPVSSAPMPTKCCPRLSYQV